MLKTWLQHSLYEQCLNTLFKSLHSNFITISERFRVGDSFAALYLCYDEWSVTVPYEVLLENAVILGVDKNTLYIEYDIMSIVEGPDNKQVITTIREVDEILISDIIRIQY
jgi:hypothetical protein